MRLRDLDRFLGPLQRRGKVLQPLQGGSELDKSVGLQHAIPETPGQGHEGLGRFVGPAEVAHAEEQIGTGTVDGRGRGDGHAITQTADCLQRICV